MAVTKEHYSYSGWGLLRFPKILMSSQFQPALPIWAWLIDTGSEKYLVDTGECTQFHEPGHFNNALEEMINKRILRFYVDPKENLDFQLAEIGYKASDIDVVILTHMHIDHIDGLRFLPNTTTLVSRKELARPHGVPFSVLPKTFKPEKIDYQTHDWFDGIFKVSDQISIVCTPGHTFGHQSVLLKVEDYEIMFAGDTTFTQGMLLTDQVGGINAQIGRSRRTIRQIKEYARGKKVIYLPSHDRISGQRLMNLDFLTI